jgi:hypothetical protein
VKVNESVASMIAPANATPKGSEERVSEAAGVNSAGGSFGQVGDLAPDQDERGGDESIERDRRLDAADGRVEIPDHG